MNLRDLHYLVAVADLRNFSQAAEQCCVSQPTLSNQIKKLEDYLGIQIFERTNKWVMLTEAGEQVIASARHIMQEVENIKEIAENARDPLAGSFRLGAFPTLSSYIFPAVVARVVEAFPRLKLILVEEKTAQIIEKLKAGQLDAAFLALPIQEELLAVEELFEDEFLLAVPPSHPLANNPQVTQQELSAHKVLLLEEGHCLRDQALSVCQLHGMAEEQDFRATSLETLRQMVKAGTGVTFMPKIAIDKEEKGICYLPFVAPAPKRTIGLVWRKTSARKVLIQRFLEIGDNFLPS